MHAAQRSTLVAIPQKPPLGFEAGSLPGWHSLSWLGWPSRQHQKPACLSFHGAVTANTLTPRPAFYTGSVTDSLLLTSGTQGVVLISLTLHYAGCSTCLQSALLNWFSTGSMLPLPLPASPGASCFSSLNLRFPHM